MKLFENFSVPRWVKLSAAFFVSYWALMFVMRLVFLFIFRTGLVAEAKQYLLTSLYVGAKFDARLAVEVCFLFLVFVLLKSLFPKIPIYISKIIAWLYAIAFSLTLLVYFGNIGHYAYLGMSLNASVFKYMEDASTSLTMVWESYPVIWGFIALILFAFAAFKWTMFLLNKMQQPQPKLSKKALSAWIVAVVILSFVLLWGQLRQFPLRWSNAYFSPNTFISNLTINPILNLYDTQKFAAGQAYDIDEVRKYYPIISEYLGVDNPDIETLNFERVYHGKKMAKRYNIVVIIMESFAYNKSSFGNPALDATPVARELAKNSVLLTQFYTPTAATAKAVFATLTGIPDVSSVKSSSRNPLIVNQNIIFNSWEGYSKFYFIGGSASWGNIRGILQHNIDGLQLYEEGKISGPRNDVWGVSDLDMFREANNVLSKSDKPFVAVLQTAGYHRPYTIPADNEGFEVKDADLDTLKRYSFGSVEEYNSLRLQDHFLGEFFKMAKQQPYYENTVFLVFGDHGLGAPVSENMPRGFVHFGLITNHVPLIIHCPALLAPQVYDFAANQVDVFPTAAGIIGMPYKTSALGRDVFDPKYKNKHGAVIFNWNSYPQTSSFLRGPHLYFNANGIEGLFEFAAKTYDTDIRDAKPETYKKLRDLANGLYKTSQFMLYHNPKK